MRNNEKALLSLIGIQLTMMIVMTIVLNKDPVLRKPGSKPHERLGRFMGMAVVDLVPTVIMGVLTGLFVSYLFLNFKKRIQYSIIGIVMIFIMGIISHAVSNIRTPLANIIMN